MQEGQLYLEKDTLSVVSEGNEENTDADAGKMWELRFVFSH